MATPRRKEVGAVPEADALSQPVDRAALVREALRDHVAVHACNRCGAGECDFRGMGEMTLGDTALPIVVLACPQCGAMVLHVAETLGVG